MRTGFEDGPQIRPWRAPAAHTGPRQDRQGLLRRRRMAALVDDIPELFGRSVVYVLAMLGLLHLLGLVVVAP